MTEKNEMNSKPPHDPITTSCDRVGYSLIGMIAVSVIILVIAMFIKPEEKT